MTTQAQDSTPWASYVPFHVIAELAATPGQAVPGVERRFDAVAMFADFSGFTALSEALGARGRGGTEELTRLLNNFFAPLIELVEAYGGIVGKFGGDAMTVLFPCRGPATDTNPTFNMLRLDPLPVVARRAVQCALEMQRFMGEHGLVQTPAGMLRLAMKAGLAAGSALTTVVGDPQIRLEYIIAGTLLDHCADAEHNAQRGEVLIHAALLPHLGHVDLPERRSFSDRRAGQERRSGNDRRVGLAGYDGPERRSGADRRSQAERRSGTDRRTGHQPRNFYQIVRLLVPAIRAPLPALPPASLQPAERFQPFLHPAIARRIEEGQADFINEHRGVTIMFVAFEGFAYEEPGAAEKLQLYLAQVVEVVQRYNGYVNKVDMGDKGSKYIILFGAPVGHEDDPQRALHCALEIQALPGPQVRIGINTGFVFCGQVGSNRRQEYTVIGDAVNLAARLMQAAQPGQIFVGEATQRIAWAPFDWGSGRMLNVKGKARPVSVFTLRGVREQAPRQFLESIYRLPMVGRTRELAFARERTLLAMRSQGQVLGITAEAGLGKTRLTAEIIRNARRQGFECYGSESLSYRTNSSYLVWHVLLRGIFGLDPAWPAERQIGELAMRLRSGAPNLEPRLPLLGPAINLSIPDNDVTASLDASLRKSALEGLIVEYLQAYGTQGRPPLLLIFEDCQWIDTLSADLLEAVARNLATLPVMLLVIYRPTVKEDTPDTVPARIGRLPHFRELRLAEFTPAETEELIRLKLNQLFASAAAPPAALVSRVAERAQGNPFYVEEMLNLLHDRGLDPTDPEALERLELPDSLHQLIISRIDQLAEETRTTIKVASVIGRQFRASWLLGVYPQLGNAAQLRTSLDQLSRLDLTPLERSEPELEYLFKHIVTREVAYESLAHATRSILHEQTGRFIEAQYAAELDRFLDLLAYHYSHSSNTAKQREYFFRAGVAAQATYANEAAIDFYQRLLPLLPESEQAEVLLRIGQVERLIGEWETAEQSYHAALALADQHSQRPIVARCRQALGELFAVRGDYGAARASLEQALESYSDLDDPTGLVESYRLIGNVLRSQSDYHAALSRLEDARALAAAQGDQRGLSSVLNEMGLLFFLQGEYERSFDSFERCYQIVVLLNDRRRIGITLGNLGNIYLQRGEYGRALECYNQYLQAALEVGDRLAASIVIGNLGNVYERQGEYARAQSCYVRNLQIALEIGDRLGVAIALWSMSTVALARRDETSAAQYLRYSTELTRAIDTPYDLCACLQTSAEQAFRQDEYAQAQQLNDEALPLAAEVEHGEVLFKSRLLAIELHVATGALTPAGGIAELRRLLAESTDESEQATLYYTIWKLDRNSEEDRERAAQLYRQLHRRTPNIEYRRHYNQLVGNQLPTPAPLPALPEVVTRNPPRLDQLLARVDDLLVEMAAESVG